MSSGRNIFTVVILFVCNARYKHSLDSGGGNRRNRGHHHYGNKNKLSAEDKSAKESVEQVDENSPVIIQFRAYSAELDDKHDRYERIVKMCRDITIESKKIIFLLHTIDRESKREGLLAEAKTRLDNLVKTLFKSIACELDGHDPYQYVRAYRVGLQEFIEAITFYQYTKETRIEDWTHLERSLVYEIQSKNQGSGEESSPQPIKVVSTLVVPNEYILGIADLTGELMRKCINNLASGDVNSCYQTCNFVRDMYKGFLGCFGISAKEINKKLYTLKQSLTKMENICYTIKVRGSEVPKHMLADVAIVAAEDCPGDDDEGYQPY